MKFLQYDTDNNHMNIDDIYVNNDFYPSRKVVQVQNTFFLCNGLLTNAAKHKDNWLKNVIDLQFNLRLY